MQKVKNNQNSWLDIVWMTWNYKIINKRYVYLMASNSAGVSLSSAKYWYDSVPPLPYPPGPNNKL